MNLLARVLGRLARAAGWRPDTDEGRGRARLYAYLDPQTALTTLHDGQLIFVDPVDEQLSPSIIAYGVWEVWIEKVIRRLLRPSDKVIEVGANVGYYTLIMSSLIGPGGRLDASRPIRGSPACSGEASPAADAALS